MEIIKKVSQLRSFLNDKNNVGCVPTMGNIHRGHLSLVSLAREKSNIVVTTIFVNRLQFNQNEDYDGYPRTLDDDFKKLESAGNDVVFCPNESEMYPEVQKYFIDPPRIAKKLEGRFRPGHFRGVCTVVTKLFNLVQPQIAVFGKKDYQQLAIIRGLVKQLSLPINIVSAETVRADSGLALSSRNRHLNKKELEEAPRLRLAMKNISVAIEEGDRNFVAMEYAAGELLARHGWKVDYVVVRTQAGLHKPTDADNELVILGAASLGNTRLIDDLEVIGPDSE